MIIRKKVDFMKKIKIRDIEIYYENNNEIKNITNIISNNYELFLLFLEDVRTISLIPTEEQNVIFIEDFEKTFSNLVYKVFDTEQNRLLLDNPDLLPAFYIESIIRRSSDNQMSLVQSNSNVSDEMLYSLIAYFYFLKTGNFDEFVEFLKEKREMNEILDWLQKETRFDAYNYLLKTTSEYLKDNEFDFLEDISFITNMMLSQAMQNILSISLDEKLDVPTIDLEKLDILFREFLTYINAPESWHRIYDNIIASGNITFKTQENETESSMCYRDENNVLKILIINDNTIKTLCTLVHEFMHYISMLDDKNIVSFSLAEFPSIFFEKIASNFLKEKGYEKELVDKMVEFRNLNNIAIYIAISGLFNDITKFIKTGPILRDEKVSFYENNLKTIQQAKENIVNIIKEDNKEVDLSFLEMPKIDIGKEVDNECDKLIHQFLQDGLLIINGYQYLLDTYLSEKIIEKSIEDASIVTKMVEITDNLNKINLKDIVEQFNIEKIIENKKDNKKI